LFLPLVAVVNEAAEPRSWAKRPRQGQKGVGSLRSRASTFLISTRRNNSGTINRSGLGSVRTSKFNLKNQCNRPKQLVGRARMRTARTNSSSISKRQDKPQRAGRDQRKLKPGTHVWKDECPKRGQRRQTVLVTPTGDVSRLSQADGDDIVLWTGLLFCCVCERTRRKISKRHVMPKKIFTDNKNNATTTKQQQPETPFFTDNNKNMQQQQKQQQPETPFVFVLLV
jgi:hypothetical protein